MVPAARSVLLHHESGPEGVERERRFFNGLRLSNGTYKETAPRRLAELDALILRHLPPALPVTVLDVGVSSGVTTADLIASLEQASHPCHATAVDLVLHGQLFRVMGALDVLTDREGYVLQVALGPLAKCRPHDPSGSALRRALEGGMNAVAGHLARRSRTGVPVRLVTSRLLTRPDVHLIEHDLNCERTEWRKRFDIVRAANVLNRDYFPEATLRTMVAHLLSYVKEGALFAACRTVPGRGNQATLFRTGTGGVTVVDRLGGGSEIESLVLNHDA